jgi:hypothetical protein
MIGRSLTRRLEHLETHLVPVVGEPTVITVEFVDAKGAVVDHKDFTVAALPPSRLRAADMVYSHAAKAIETEDIDARVTELERATEIAKSSR